MRVTLTLLVLNAVAFLLQHIIAGFTELFSLTPSMALSGGYWQFITYMFMHAPGTPYHIGINMFVLLIFGAQVERELGRWKYLSLYLISGLGSALLYMVLTNVDILMLGASGAVFGLLAAYGVFYPRRWIIMFPGIPMPAAFLVIFFAGIEIFFGLSGLQPGIANFGHLGGIIAGALMAFIWKRRAERHHKWERDFEFVWE